MQTSAEVQPCSLLQVLDEHSPHCRADVWHKQASRHFARHPRAAEVLFYGFMLDLPACFLMYLPVIFIWPLWLWWALMLPRLSRWVLSVKPPDSCAGHHACGGFSQGSWAAEEAGHPSRSLVVLTIMWHYSVPCGGGECPC